MPITNLPVWRPERFANPAPAAGFTITPTRSEAWRLRSLAFQLVTDATVGNRNITLAIGDGNDVWWRGAIPTLVPASQTVQYTAYDGGFPGTDAGGLVTLRWPAYGPTLRLGDVLTVALTGAGVADQISAIAAFILEYPTGPWFQQIPDQPTDVLPLDY